MTGLEITVPIYRHLYSAVTRDPDLMYGIELAVGV